MAYGWDFLRWFLYFRQFFLEQQKQHHNICEQGNASDAQTDNGNNPDDIDRFLLGGIDLVLLGDLCPQFFQLAALNGREFFYLLILTVLDPLQAE